MRKEGLVEKRQQSPELMTAELETSRRHDAAVCLPRRPPPAFPGSHCSLPVHNVNSRYENER